MTLDEWAAVVLGGLISNDEISASAIFNDSGAREKLATCVFHMAKAMQEESIKRNDSLINRQLSKLKGDNN